MCTLCINIIMMVVVVVDIIDVDVCVVVEDAVVDGEGDDGGCARRAG